MGACSYRGNVDTSAVTLSRIRWQKSVFITSIVIGGRSLHPCGRSVNFDTMVTGGQRGTVVLGVTGGIACYKAVELVRLLVTSAFKVQVIMTRGAMEFDGFVTGDSTRDT